MADVVVVKDSEEAEKTTPAVVETPASADGAIIQMAKEAGQTQAKVDELHEEHEEIEEKVTTIENKQKWTDEDISYLRERIYALEDKVENNEVEEEQEEMTNTIIEGEEEEKEGEKVEVIEEKKSSPISLLIALVIAAGVVFGISKFGNRNDGEN